MNRGKRLFFSLCLYVRVRYVKSSVLSSRGASRPIWLVQAREGIYWLVDTFSLTFDLHRSEGTALNYCLFSNHVLSVWFSFPWLTWCNLNFSCLAIFNQALLFVMKKRNKTIPHQTVNCILHQKIELYFLYFNDFKFEESEI